MFYYLNGILAGLYADFAVIDCSGVGYKVSISASTSSKLSGFADKKVLLYTYMVVRDDSVELFGFYDEDELSVFKKLITVSGVGPKSAMSILGSLTADGLRRAIASNDYKTIATAQGIGSKTAQRIAMELRDKIGAADEYFAENLSEGGSEKISQTIDTLTLYGFSRSQVMNALKHVNRDMPLENIISDTLRILGKEGRN